MQRTNKRGAISLKKKASLLLLPGHALFEPTTLPVHGQGAEGSGSDDEWDDLLYATGKDSAELTDAGVLRGRGIFIRLMSRRVDCS